MEYWLWEAWTCSWDLPSSWFMGCDGSKYLFTNQVYNASARLFSITRSSPTAPYFLQVNSGAQDSHLLKGKVINLVMDCTAAWLGNQIVNLGSCLVFKLEGTETCSVNKPSNSTNSSSYVASLSMSRIETQTPIISSSASMATPLTVLGTTLASYSSVTSLTTSHATSVIPTTSPITSNWSPTSTIVTALHTSSTAFKSSPETFSIPLAISTSEITPRASPSSLSAIFSSVKASHASPPVSISSLQSSTVTPIVPSILPTTSMALQSVSTLTPLVSSSSPNFISLRTVIIDASLTVTVVPKVIEVSPTTREAQETPVVFLPTEPGVNPSSFEPIIPPNVSSRRRSNRNRLVIGLLVGIMAAVIVTVIVIALLIQKRRNSRSTYRPRSVSEETKISVLMSPRTKSVQETGEDGSDPNTLKRSPMYVPNYRIPLWQNEEDNTCVYAVLHFPEGVDGRVRTGEEPIYNVLEEPATNNEEGIKNGQLIETDEDVFHVIDDKSGGDSGPGAYDNHIYAEVVRKPKRRTAIKSKGPSNHSKHSQDTLPKALEPYIRSAEESDEDDTPDTENAIYFTLEKCFSDSFKRANNDSVDDKTSAGKTLKGPDQYKAVCTEALVFCTKRSGSRRSINNNNEARFTIEQVFDDLEARYLQGTGVPEKASSGQAETTSELEMDNLKKARSDSKKVNESVYNFLEEVCRQGLPTFQSVSSQEGPVYFTLKRLKSNHSKATRMRPKWVAETGSNALEERFLKRVEGCDLSDSTSAEKPVFFTLESCCSDSLTRDKSDTMHANEPVSQGLEERYLKRAEGPGQSFTSRSNDFNNLERIYSDSFKIPNSESHC